MGDRTDMGPTRALGFLRDGVGGMKLFFSVFFKLGMGFLLFGIVGWCGPARNNKNEMWVVNWKSIECLVMERRGYNFGNKERKGRKIVTGVLRFSAVDCLISKGGALCIILKLRC